jgi:hypothetical protein
MAQRKDKDDVPADADAISEEVKKAEPKPVAKPAAAVKPVREIPRMRVRNKLGQAIDISVTDGDGRVQSVRLAPYGMSDPHYMDRFTPHTQQLAARRHVEFVK